MNLLSILTSAGFDRNYVPHETDTLGSLVSNVSKVGTASASDLSATGSDRPTLNAVKGVRAWLYSGAQTLRAQGDAFRPGAGSFTAAALIRMPAGGNKGQFGIYDATSGETEWCIQTIGNNKFELDIVPDSGGVSQFVNTNAPDRLLNKWYLVVVGIDRSAGKAFSEINGVRQEFDFSPAVKTSVGDLLLGSINYSGYYHTGHIAAFSYVNSALSPSVLQGLNTSVQSILPPENVKPNQVVAYGNSLTAGNGATDGFTYPAQLGTLLGSEWVLSSNSGMSGWTTTQMRTNAVGWVDYYLDRESYNKSVLILWEGRNYLFLNNGTPQQAIDEMRLLCEERFAAGWTDIYVPTITKSDYVGADTPETNAKYAEYNTLLRAQGPSFCTEIVDLDLHPEIALGAPHSTVYFDDDLHMKNPGYGIVAEDLAYRIDGFKVLSASINSSRDKLTINYSKYVSGLVPEEYTLSGAALGNPDLYGKIHTMDILSSLPEESMPVLSYSGNTTVTDEGNPLPEFSNFQVEMEELNEAVVLFHDDFNRADTNFGEGVGSPSIFEAPDPGTPWEGNLDKYKIENETLVQVPVYGQPFNVFPTLLRRPYSTEIVDSKIRVVLDFAGDPADTPYQDLTREFFLTIRDNADSRYFLSFAGGVLSLAWTNNEGIGPSLAPSVSMSKPIKTDGTKYVVAMSVRGVGVNTKVSAYIKLQSTGEVLASIDEADGNTGIADLTLKQSGTFGIAFNQGYTGRQTIYSVTGYDLTDSKDPSDDDVTGNEVTPPPAQSFKPSIVDGLEASYNADNVDSVWINDQAVSFIPDQIEPFANSTNGGIFRSNGLNNRGGVLLTNKMSLGNPSKLQFTDNSYTLFAVLKPRNLRFYDVVISKLVSNSQTARLFLITALGLENYQTMGGFLKKSPLYANRVNQLCYSYNASTKEQILRVNGHETARVIDPNIEPWSQDGTWAIGDVGTTFGSFFPYSRLLEEEEIETIESEIDDHYLISDTKSAVNFICDGNSLWQAISSQTFGGDWETVSGLPAWSSFDISGKNQYQITQTSDILASQFTPGVYNGYSSFEGQNANMSEEVYQSTIENWQKAADAGFRVIAWCFADCRRYNPEQEALRLVFNQRFRDMLGQPGCPFTKLIDDPRFVNYGTFNIDAVPQISPDGTHLTPDIGNPLFVELLRSAINEDIQDYNESTPVDPPTGETETMYFNPVGPHHSESFENGNVISLERETDANVLLIEAILFPVRYTLDGSTPTKDHGFTIKAGGVLNLQLGTDAVVKLYSASLTTKIQYQWGAY
jgi:hypothetical protein